MESLKESVRALHMEVTRELAVRYVIHLCCMLERLIQEEVLPHQETEILKEKYKHIFETVKRSLRPLEDCLHLQIPDSETAYLVEMILEEKESCRLD